MKQNTLQALEASFKAMPRPTQLALVEGMKANLSATLTPAIVATFPADLRAKLAKMELPV